MAANTHRWHRFSGLFTAHFWEGFTIRMGGTKSGSGAGTCDIISIFFVGWRFLGGTMMHITPLYCQACFYEGHLEHKA